jgi:hypothetical protein
VEILFLELVRYRILIGLLILLILLLLVSWVARQPPSKPYQLYLIQAGIVTTIVALMALVMTRQLHWVFAILGGLLPVGVRLVQVASGSATARRARRRSSTAKSANDAEHRSTSSSGRQGTRITTRYLRAFTDQATGEIRGKVLKGLFAGSHLSELTREQLNRLHKKYSEQDAESAALLAAYLDKERGGTEGEAPGADGEEKTQDSTESEDAQASSRRPRKNGGMTHAEAYEILGLTESADAQAVTDAHRRLMQKMHPDRGGTNYLAAKINQAKDLLLARLAQ